MDEDEASFSNFMMMMLDPIRNYVLPFDSSLEQLNCKTVFCAAPHQTRLFCFTLVGCCFFFFGEWNFTSGNAFTWSSTQQPSARLSRIIVLLTRSRIPALRLVFIHETSSSVGLREWRRNVGQAMEITVICIMENK